MARAPLDEGDLEGLWAEGIKAAAPQDYVGRLVDAARTRGALEAGIEPSYPLGLAAEICEEIGELEQALALIDEDIARHAPGDTPAYRLAKRADLLIQLDRKDEGMALLESLRPLMGDEPTAAMSIGDVLEKTGQQELAVEWLTVTVRRLLPGLAELPAPAIRELDYVVALRRRLRSELGLEPDQLDQLERLSTPSEDDYPGDWGDEDFDEEPPGLRGLLFWPADQYALVIEKWPAVAGGYGPDWETYRTGLKWLAEDYRERGPVQLVRVTMDDFRGFCDEHDLDPATDESRLLYATERTRLGFGVDYPPERNAPCWCESGRKYKKCCLLR